MEIVAVNDPFTRKQATKCLEEKHRKCWKHEELYFVDIKSSRMPIKLASAKKQKRETYYSSANLIGLDFVANTRHALFQNDAVERNVFITTRNGLQSSRLRCPAIRSGSSWARVGTLIMLIFLWLSLTVISMVTSTVNGMMSGTRKTRSFIDLEDSSSMIREI